VQQSDAIYDCYDRSISRHLHLIAAYS